MKKVFLSVALSLFFILSLNAQNKINILKESVSDLDISFDFTDDFVLNNLKSYTKNAVGFSSQIEYSILDGLFEKTDLGIFGNFAYKNFISANEELVSLQSCNFIGGFLCKRTLAQEIELLAQIGAGISMSKLKYVSADSGDINDVFYDFVLTSAFSVRKPFYKAKNLNILSDTGLTFAFQKEKTNNFFTLGAKFGFVFDFSPLK